MLRDLVHPDMLTRMHPSPALLEALNIYAEPVCAL